MRVVNRTREILLGDKVRTAGTFPPCLAGLLGTAAIAEGEGLWIVPCRSVHTLGMRYPVDVAFLDAQGGPATGWSSKRADRLDTAGRRLLHCVLALSLPEC